MSYTVVWQPAAKDNLAEIWLDSEDRGWISSAADEIDENLRLSPETCGESRRGRSRVVIVPPLVVYFDVHGEDRLVRVLAVRQLR
jgi:plasmid stabilization system protein ParE